jgi:uncharacterized Zn-binding protein involved in type VI secretion
MGQPAARQTDQVTGSDTHLVLVPSITGTTPTLLPGHVFSGRIGSKTWSDVRIEGQPAATVGSVARNVPPHVPVPAARRGDPVRTCNDPVDTDGATIMSGARSVNIG